MQEQTGQTEIPEQESRMKDEVKLEVVGFEEESGFSGLIDPLLRQGDRSQKPRYGTY